jgi:hypothetical protein
MYKASRVLASSVHGVCTRLKRQHDAEAGLRLHVDANQLLRLPCTSLVCSLLALPQCFCGAEHKVSRPRACLHVKHTLHCATAPNRLTRAAEPWEQLTSDGADAHTLFLMRLHVAPQHLAQILKSQCLSTCTI